MKKKSSGIDKKVFVKKLISSIGEDEMIGMSAQTAYYFIVALVPFLIVFINIILFFAANNIGIIENYLKNLLPREAVEQLAPIIDNIISSRAEGGASVAIGLLVALWSSSNAIKSLIKALNKAFNVSQNQDFVTTKGKSILFTLMMVAIMLFVIFFLIFGDLILDGILALLRVNLPGEVRRSFRLFKYLIPIGSMILGFTFFYKKAPHFDETHHISWKSALAGGALASIGWVVVSVVYSVYATTFSDMPLQYGPLFGIFAMFVWLFLTSMLIIFAGEFISVYDQMKKGVFVSN